MDSPDNYGSYIRNFADKDGKVWHGEGGQNMPPEAPHLIGTTSDIEDLLPKPPMKPAADAVPWLIHQYRVLMGEWAALCLQGFDMYSYSAQTNGDC
ncbi:hypothetical protein M0R45_038075 [Rubus argutus]|uniref:Uncharacterized protein n=1 Tax=Rubus argutus TaxID=59490 RepID=A0AAW1W182_RUBAR